ncbi:MAG: hypothetical protein H6518_13665 [Microthrixaceae bacterium]|nr:hypothetical protein [Microthrixaceae bacterium]
MLRLNLEAPDAAAQLCHCR